MWSVILFGVLGFGFTIFRIPIAPFILGFILGPMAETNLRRGLMLHKNSFAPLFESPICLLFLGVAVLSLALTAYKQVQRRNRTSLRRTLSGRTFNKDGEEEEPKL
jgi:putative tricarboxylic transport membrane protein